MGATQVPRDSENEEDIANSVALLELYGTHCDDLHFRVIKGEQRYFL